MENNEFNENQLQSILFNNGSEYENIEERIIEKTRKYLVVVIYDITDDKRRSKIAKFLNGYGLRVQRSCFECILDFALYQKLISEIEKYISEEDLLRVYRLTGNMEVKTWGILGKLEDDDFIVI